MNVHSRRNESGMTLVELLITVVIVSLITGTLAMAFASAVNQSGPARQRARENNDAQTIAGWLVRDAQAAGGSSPQTGQLNTTLGVSTSDAAGCTVTGTTVIARFKWRDWTGAATYHDNVVVYLFNASTNTVSRASCVDGGAAVSLPLASTVSANPAPAAGCANADGTASACEPNLPDIVRLSVSALNNPVNAVDPLTHQPTAYNYILTAAVRPQAQTPPSAANATKIPLLALGSACGGGVTGIDAQGGGASTIVVYGGAAVNGGCPAVSFQGSIDFTATGGIGVLAPGTCAGVDDPGCQTFTQPIQDPYATLTPPTANCAADNHPANQGNTYFPGTYKNALSVNGATFNPGIYVFCAGVTTSGTTTADGVLFYITGGTITVSGNLSMSAMHSGIYGDGTDGNTSAANIVVWQAKTDAISPQICCSNNTVASFDGTFYAPGAIVTLHNGTLSFGSLVALGVSWSGGGNGGTTFGDPVSLPAITETSLKSWTINRTYSTTMHATGGSGGYAWTATGLPTGLSITPGGVIQGTPTATGTFTTTVTVQDSIGQSVQKTYTVNINPVPTIATSSLPTWTINRNYPNTAVTTTPGTGTSPFTWAATGLPAGLTMNASTGVIGGTPTAAGTATVNITVTDAAGATGTRTLALTINAAPTIASPATLADATVNAAYPNTTINANNGTAPPYTWAASGLPTGMSINASTGVVSGTPTVAGNYTATITVTDVAGATASKNYAFKINNPPTVGAPTLNAWTVNRPYSDTATASGGTPPYTFSATGLPTGLTIAPATGVVSGTPTVANNYSVTISVKDASNVTRNTTYTLKINAAPTISSPATLPTWTMNRTYPNTTLTGTLGTPFAGGSYNWSATGLPAGITINASTGVINGSATASGTFNVTVTLTDAAGATATKPYTLVINSAPGITTATLPGGERTVAYNATMAASNGTPAYTWAASGLPAGLSISAGGTISGTPTVAGVFNVQFTVTDSAGASDTKTIALTLNQTPTITSGTGTLQDWTVNQAYPATTITSINGTAPITWSATGLPAGMTINAATGTISGTPTATGNFSALVTAKDNFNVSTTATFSFKINGAPSITTASLPNWTVNAAYPSTTMTSSGGTAPVGWSATGLPDGLAINPSTGAITGTPTSAASFSVSVTVTDNAGASATRNYTVVINGAISITSSSLPDGEANVAYNATVTKTGGSSPLSWSASGLPTGLSINASSGVISGTTTQTGTFSVNVSVSEGGGTSDSRTLSLKMYPQLVITTTSPLAGTTVNRPYPNTTINATGGFGSYNWSATGLPAGLSINASTGVISGTPTATGTFNGSITVTDGATPAGSATKSLSITIANPPSVSPATCTGRSGNALNFTLTVSGGTAPVTLGISGQPAGVTLTNGKLTGTVPSNGTYTFTISATDAAGAVGNTTFTLIAKGNNSGLTC